MKRCRFCQTLNPESARYCMECGQRLPDHPPAEKPGFKFNLKGSQTFFLTLAGSLLLSFVLIAVFKLPIFILAAFLPLLWTSNKNRSR